MKKIWVTRRELRDMIREMAGACPSDCECDDCASKKMKESKKGKRKVNPWAVCHASTGPEKSASFERCVKDVKKQSGMK